MLGIEEFGGATVAEVQHLSDHRLHVVRDGGPLERFVRQRVVVEVHQLHATADLAVQSLEQDVARTEITVPVAAVLAVEDLRKQRGRTLGADGADDPLVAGLVVVHRREGFGRECGSDAQPVVAIADECADQIGKFREVGRLGDHLAREPVVEQQLDRHRTPAKRVARRVVGAEPQHRLEEAALVLMIERGAEPGGEEVSSDGCRLLGGPLLAFGSDRARGQLAQDPLHQRPAHRPAVRAEGRVEARSLLDGCLDHGTCGRGVGAGQSLIGVVDRCPDLEREVLERLGDHEGVLHDRAEVVVDVHQDRQEVPGRQHHADQVVVAVAQHMG